MKQIDKKVLLALSAPMGFVILSIMLYYSLKRLDAVSSLSVFKIPKGFEVFIIIPIAAIFGSYFGARLSRALMKLKIPLLLLTIGALLGYELGIGLEIVILRFLKSPFVKDMLYYFVVVVLMTGFLGALIGVRLTKHND